MFILWPSGRALSSCASRHPFGIFALPITDGRYRFIEGGVACLNTLFMGLSLWGQESLAVFLA